MSINLLSAIFDKLCFDHEVLGDNDETSGFTISKLFLCAKTQVD